MGEIGSLKLKKTPLSILDAGLRLPVSEYALPALSPEKKQF